MTVRPISSRWITAASLLSVLLFVLKAFQLVPCRSMADPRRCRPGWSHRLRRRAAGWRLRGYQATGPLAAKYPPVGPSGPAWAIATMIAAPSSTVWVPVPPLRSVAV